MASRVLEKAFDSPAMFYDIAQFHHNTWWAGQHYDANADFAAGAGPGLFRRFVGDTSVPVAVAGSEAYRFYALTTFDDKLVGLGCLTADITVLAGATPALKWYNNTPPDIYVFESDDGLTWNEHLVGEIETDLGTDGSTSYPGYPGSLQNTLMESACRWVESVTLDDNPCIRMCTGTNIVQWTGNAPPTYTALTQRASGIATASGRDYLTGDRYWIEYREGLLVMHDTTATSGTSLLVRAPLAGDGQQTFVSPLSSTARITFADGVMMAAGHGYGHWVLIFSPTADADEDEDSHLGALLMHRLPREPLTIEVDNITALAKPVGDANTRWFDRVLGGDDPMFVRFAEGNAYVFQTTDMYQQDAGLDTVPVFQVPMIDYVGPVGLHACRVTWTDGSGDSPTLGAARVTWRDGSGSSPTLSASRVTWRAGITIAGGDKKIVYTATFDQEMTHIRIAFHEKDLTDAEGVTVGVRDNAATAAVTDWESYDPVASLHNHRMNEPATAVDIVFVVPAGQIIGPPTVTGHTED